MRLEEPIGFDKRVLIGHPRGRALVRAGGCEATSGGRGKGNSGGWCVELVVSGSGEGEMELRRWWLGWACWAVWCGLRAGLAGCFGLWPVVRPGWFG
jgi:hypothetical protein